VRRTTAGGGAGASVWETLAPELLTDVVLCLFRRGADENVLPDQPFVLGGDLLGDAASERKAQQIDFRKAEQIDEGDCIPRRRCDNIRRLAGRATDPGVVEGDYSAIGGVSVDDAGNRWHRRRETNPATDTDKVLRITSSVRLRTSVLLDCISQRSESALPQIADRGYC